MKESHKNYRNQINNDMQSVCDLAVTKNNSNPNPIIVLLTLNLILTNASILN